MRAAGPSRKLLRAVSHLVAEVPLFVVVGLQLARGWVPTSDDAVIAWRTWDVFSGPVPLEGQFSQISAVGGHSVFDLGPLQYYLLALPERIDPVHGVLWGGALVCAVLLAIAIEAAWSWGGAAAGALAGAGAALLTATLVESTVNLAWNPSVGLYAFAATLLTGIAAGSGRLGWLPVAVAAASLAAQSHISFALPAAAVLFAAVVFGWGAPKCHRGRLVGLAVLVLVACWIAPLYEQLTGRPGNWSVLGASLGRHGPPVGIDLGLRGLAAATRIAPTWLTRPPPVGTVALFRRFEHVVYGGSLDWGIAALALCALTGICGALAKRRRLAALGAVGALAGLATAWTLGSVPVSQLHFLGYYLYFVLWPVGMVMDAALLGGLGSVVVVFGRHWRASSTVPAGLSLATTIGATVALASGGAGLIAIDVPLGSSGLFLLGWEPVAWTAKGAPQALALARAHGYGPGRDAGTITVVTTNGLAFVDSAVSEGVGYLLVTEGISARLNPPAATPLGPGLAARPASPSIVVHLSVSGGRPVTAVSWKPAPHHA
ncbi:MAG: hypothetical protein ACYCSF_07235 [Acidimicrobiales bacterium]